MGKLGITNSVPVTVFFIKKSKFLHVNVAVSVTESLSVDGPLFGQNIQDFPLAQVNNAGWSVMMGILNSTLADLDAMLNVLIRANFTITQRALPTIIKHKGIYLN